MIQIENISKVFRTTEVETVALNYVNLGSKGRRVCSHYGTFWAVASSFTEYSWFIG